jgi:hypothetical protein
MPKVIVVEKYCGCPDLTKWWRIKVFVYCRMFNSHNKLNTINP